MSYDIKKIRIDDVLLIHKNFSGRETQFNREGNRCFDVVIDDDDLANRMKDDGWNVKTKVKDDGSNFNFLPIQISYKYKAPHVHMIVNNRHTELTSEEELNRFDDATILKCDIGIRPRLWDPDHHKIKAYLDELWITIEGEYYEEKYRNLGVEGI